MSIEAAIAETVQEAVREGFRPFLRRLTDPECLTYNPREAAAVIGCSERAVGRWVASGVLPRVANLSNVLIPRVAVEAFALGADPHDALRRAVDDSVSSHRLRSVS